MQKICDFPDCNNIVEHPERNRFCSKDCSCKNAVWFSIKKRIEKTRLRALETIKQQNCVLLSGEYIDNSTRNLEIRCSCGNVSIVSWQDIKNAIWKRKKFFCNECVLKVHKKSGAPKKYTYFDIEKIVVDNSCKLLTSYDKNHEYITKDNLDYKCSCGKWFTKEFGGFMKKPYCPNCGRTMTGKKYSYEQVQNIFKTEGCELLSLEYVKAKDLLIYRCQCGRIFKDSLERFIRKKQCNHCNKQNFYDHIEETVKKIYDTKKKNNSFHTSQIEKDVLKMLLKHYPSVISQHKDKKRYPYLCDFYIPEKDLFIELNFHWCHDDHPFNENSLQDIEKIELWKKRALNKKFYQSAIVTWTIKDKEKINRAKKESLNYIIIYKSFDVIKELIPYLENTYINGFICLR